MVKPSNEDDRVVRFARRSIRGYVTVRQIQPGAVSLGKLDHALAVVESVIGEGFAHMLAQYLVSLRHSAHGLEDAVYPSLQPGLTREEVSPDQVLDQKVIGTAPRGMVPLGNLVEVFPLLLDEFIHLALSSSVQSLQCP